jgi:hypothetical protein
MFDRFWMPQYVVWVSPWVYLLQSWYGESWKEGHPISAVFRGFPLFFSATFLLAVPPNFPKNVDSSMYTHWKLGPTLGTDLLPYGVPLFLLHTACYWILPVLVLGVILQKGRTEPFKESQPYTTSWAHLLLFLVWADLFMLWPILRP